MVWTLDSSHCGYLRLAVVYNRHISLFMDPLKSSAYPVPRKLLYSSVVSPKPALTLDIITVSHVLESPYQLIYAVPLLVLSVPVAFGGAFLTLDRTRSFVPADQIIRDKTVWRFEGGLGGLLGGWIFGGSYKASYSH